MSGQVSPAGPSGPSGRRPVPAGFFALDSAEYGRGISFFDAVYGFSATLLIANLDAPPAQAWHSWSSLLDSGVGSQLFGFVLSFIVIVAFWRSNVRIMGGLTGLDGPTLVANLVAVALVMLIPFTTQGIADPGSGAFALPTAVYAANIALAAVAQIALVWVAERRGLVRDPATGRERTLGILLAWLPPLVFGLSIPIALAIGSNAQWTWLSLAFLMPLVGRLADSAEKASGTAEVAQ